MHTQSRQFLNKYIRIYSLNNRGEVSVDYVNLAPPLKGRQAYFFNIIFFNDFFTQYFNQYFGILIFSSSLSEYSQNNYNTNSARAQTSSTYRGTPAPAPVVQATSVREEVPKRGKPVYLQNNNYNQDIYQQSTVADYQEDNRYDAQVSQIVCYRYTEWVKETTFLNVKSVSIAEIILVYRNPPFFQPQTEHGILQCKLLNIQIQINVLSFIPDYVYCSIFDHHFLYFIPILTFSTLIFYFLILKITIRVILTKHVIIFLNFINQKVVYNFF